MGAHGCYSVLPGRNSQVNERNLSADINVSDFKFFFWKRIQEATIHRCVCTCTKSGSVSAVQDLLNVKKTSRMFEWGETDRYEGRQIENMCRGCGGSLRRSDGLELIVIFNKPHG